MQFWIANPKNCEPSSKVTRRESFATLNKAASNPTYLQPGGADSAPPPPSIPKVPRQAQ